MSDSSYPGAASSSASNCPTCGTSLPAGARFCPNCGTRVQQGAAYAPDAFRTAVDDVLDDREQAPETPSEARPAGSDVDTIQIPVSGVTPSFDESPVAAEWQPEAVSSSRPSSEPGAPSLTATPADWTIQTPTSGATTAAPRRRENRTLWIILAIFGGIVFCCCALFFLLFAVSSADSSFQDEVSLIASFM